MNKKAISAIWLSETGLTNLNSGVGGSNLVDLKKYKIEGVDYPYVSGQAMRYYLKESIRRLASPQEYCVANEKGETCGDITNCILCDLFGFMTTLKDQGAQIRVSPIKMSPAMGLLPLNDNMTVDFLTRRKPQESAGELKGDIVNVELAVNIYKAGLSIDLAKVGGEEIIENKKMQIKDRVSSDVKTARIKTALEAFKNLSDYSKQARLLTDFTPNLILIAIQDKYNHVLQKALELKDGKNLNVERLDQVLRSLKGDKIYAGLLSGTLGNEEDIKQILTKHGIELKTPIEAIDMVIAEVD
ncbi:type I-B CRISPR-associated protein Cas7/Cst2/DevR [Methanosaeta sp. UBA356]|jgi:CRISPR-associated protein Cst2|uniref:type I-B CRISPR-associated protein Cas7/Cst2/DevR n=1 Tax=Methanosaeta sp. UBA356 TaxID=1915559 RepID=UPI00257A66D0|nr:type I-B CRISPR-associated protein Cas7/Cst2/DevR [Methanosaeta sp. UBA356]